LIDSGGGLTEAVGAPPAAELDVGEPAAAVVVVDDVAWAAKVVVELATAAGLEVVLDVEDDAAGVEDEEEEAGGEAELVDATAAGPDEMAPAGEEVETGGVADEVGREVVVDEDC